ncbi:hypothetical protein [Microbacterium sp. WCS2018Hpa-23]|uniref:hypothetical protein n=1 Tax=Microbacterium sp. WCS2018Hpa-23 TaxID=3073634 RepID=UPI002882E897|nr:hypothetical protein [Microbacterium sp. WCS2018Hpa-23]
MTSCPRDGFEECPRSCERDAAQTDESGFWFLGGASALGASILMLPTVQPEWWSILTIVVTFTGAAVMFIRGAVDWCAERRRAATCSGSPSM